VTIQAQILTLIEQLQKEMGLAVILITHDLGVIAETCEEVIVMYAGRIAEQAPVNSLFARPRHPYTRGLLASIPRLATPRKTRMTTIEGVVPTLRDLPAGCRFKNRCPYAEPRCATAAPPLETTEDGHQVACIRWKELK
jgi:oligopeptide/dipeptide ABC transporter ATP-binding protein